MSPAPPPPARGRPQAARAALIGHRIIEAAWGLLVDVGPEAFTIDALALRARASKQTIYARFAGKQPLLAAVLASRLRRILAAVEEGGPAPSPLAHLADLAARAVLALSEPEARLFDRLIDWIDNAEPASTQPTGTQPTRRAVYAGFHAAAEGHLAHFCARWQCRLEDLPAVAAFWVEGLVGHVRCAITDADGHRDWAHAYAAHFLRAQGWAGNGRAD
ncbi:MAG TPA: helix-turn-helix domain-containing protein [Novosphingobium sp.]|nr:helix-turn-helix domain-containing protein [Novosphingobium sp.]